MPIKNKKIEPYLILFFLPFIIRTFIGSLINYERSYTSVSAINILSDPSIVAFLITSLCIPIFLFKKIAAIIELLKIPLVLFVLYSIIGTFFGLLTDYKLLAIFIGYELFIYYLLASMLIVNVHEKGEKFLLLFENYFYILLVFLMSIAYIDILLPFTNPFSIELSGRSRFNGYILHLVSIQWSAISSICLIISLSFIFRKTKNIIYHYIIAILSLILLLLCGSRGAIAGCTIASFFLFVNIRRKITPLGWMIIFFVVTLLTSLSIIINWKYILSVLEDFFRLSNESNLFTLGGRLKLWTNAIGNLLSYPFMGYGIGTRGARPPLLSHSMHNFILEVWVGSGTIGVILFCSGFFIVLKRLVFRSIKFSKILQHDNKEIKFSLIATASVFIYLCLHGMVESNIAGTNNIFSVAFLYCVIYSQSLKSI